MKTISSPFVIDVGTNSRIGPHIKARSGNGRYIYIKKGAFEKFESLLQALSTESSKRQFLNYCIKI